MTPDEHFRLKKTFKTAIFDSPTTSNCPQSNTFDTIKLQMYNYVVLLFTQKGTIMSFKHMICALSVLTAGLHATVHTSDPHSTCAVLRGLQEGTPEFDACIQEVEAANAAARSGSTRTTQPKAQSSSSSSCCNKQK